MKKPIFYILVALIMWGFPASAVYAGDISAKAAIVYEPRSGSVLYEKAADEPMLVASTTKIMTAKVVLDNCSLDECVKVTSAHAAVEGSSMHLRPGESYTVEDLLYGLMLASGNDAAAALAEHTAGSMEAFAGLMNAECEALGLENTHFVNSHGLDADGQHSSARDLALITAAAMENEIFCEIFSTVSHSVKDLSYTNHNKLLTSCPGCIGGKTGYTEKAGRILVSCVEREGMRLICVTISDPRDWEDHKALYDKCFEEYEFLTVPDEKLSLDIISGERLTARLEGCLPGACVPVAEGAFLRLHLPRFAFAPVICGEKAGWAEIVGAGGSLGCFDILFSETVPLDSAMAKSPWLKLRNDTN